MIDNDVIEEIARWRNWAFQQIYRWGKCLYFRSQKRHAFWLIHVEEVENIYRLYEAINVSVFASGFTSQILNKTECKTISLSEKELQANKSKNSEVNLNIHWGHKQGSNNLSLCYDAVKKQRKIDTFWELTKNINSILVFYLPSYCRKLFES